MNSHCCSCGHNCLCDTTQLKNNKQNKKVVFICLTALFVQFAFFFTLLFLPFFFFSWVEKQEVTSGFMNCYEVKVKNKTFQSCNTDEYKDLPTNIKDSLVKQL